ncbi:MBL fold metallo-hydrolase [Calidifontibacillus erzurumensis]|uniref:MBL fold metallo-hydrolase n=1 Tax=Calidifontibacillus erzurumensis TaxID=2741433 RepID=UPI0035B50EBD
MQEHIEEVAKNIYRIPIPVPFPMKYVYCYLLKNDEEWVMIDTGLNYKAARDAWLETFNQLQIDLMQVSMIFVTHFHPDHFGLSGWLQEKTGAKVFMSEVEYKIARTVWFKEGIQAEAIANMMRSHGVSDALASSMADNMIHLRKNVLPLPEVSILRSKKLTIADKEWEIIEASGHSDGQLCFYDKKDRMMIVADQVLNKITPNISKWPNASDNPLFQYFNSLSMLKGYDVKRALPGHGVIIDNFIMRIDEILKHHENRLQKIKNVLKGFTTAYEVACQIFKTESFTPHQWRFAMAETLAHLEYLVSTGEIERQQINERFYYSIN